ncbi:response regulator transcription factor [Thiomicrospira pelophila]|uniref:response regulator transcription factor n=1 Tax=Thiomicrospira pelophila TaxID=934 RepID=UPI0004A6DEC6|nr:response regulator transcription factor [Thiomicrospira pelophila]
MRLLIVEDEVELQNHLASQLKSQGYLVDQAFDGEEALYLMAEFNYDLVILDLGLPKRPGLDVLRIWREQHLTTPVIILTARNAWQERVEGLRVGADDYLGKPFHFEELLARVQATLRRGQQPLDESLQVAGWQLNLDTKVLSHRDGRHFQPTANEFRVLRLLMKRPGQIFSKEQILERLGNQDSESEGNLVEVYIRRLRQMVGKTQIQTQRGLGYRFCSEEER